MIVFDAGILIAHLSTDDPFHERVGDLLEEFEEFDFAASALTVAESLVYAAKAGKATKALAAFDRLMLLQLDLSAADALGIAEIRAATGLRMPDAVVIYTAERHLAELATTDRALANAAGRRGVSAHLL